MTGKQVMTVTVLVAVLVWSTVMTVLGQLAAMAALLPSLGLLVQQIVTALGGSTDTRPVPPPAAAAGSEEPSR
ncbi:hypothetical protein [Streptomyces sp. NPDC090083]|uniref:hypothetical protein n=1 Tax=Streptomyces sp. NPDC090083 TaxID=3365941 RepID=UPI0037F46DC3